MFVHPDGQGECPFCGESISIEVPDQPKVKRPRLVPARPHAYEKAPRRTPTVSISRSTLLLGFGLLFVCGLTLGGIFVGWRSIVVRTQQDGPTNEIVGASGPSSVDDDQTTKEFVRPTLTSTHIPTLRQPSSTSTPATTSQQITFTPIPVTPTRTPTRRRPTRTPTLPPPTDTPVSVPPPLACGVTMARDGTFYNLWNRYSSGLGCPHQSRQLGADSIDFVEQSFDKGHMFFFSSGPVNFVIVKYGVVGSGETGSGTWQSFDSGPWSGKDENFCFEGQGLPYPIYDSFNQAWCADPNVRSGLGNPKSVDSRVWARETGADNSQHVLAQGFDNGFILRDSDGASHGLAYIFFQNGNYVRERY